MMVRTIARFLVISGILALLISGCVTITSNNNTTPTPPIEVKMTQSAQVKPTLAVKAPTLPPQPTNTPTPALPEMKEYTYPSNSYSISVPLDWTSDESSGYVALFSPDGNVSVEVVVENTGNALDADAFTKVVNAYECNEISHSDNYKEIAREIQADKGIAWVNKNLDLLPGPMNVATIYEQKGKVLYIQNYISAVSAGDQYGPILTAMKDSFKSNPAGAESLSPFTSSLTTITEGDDLFSLVVPSLWTRDEGEVNAFTSPDENAAIILIQSDQGKTVTRTLADPIALFFLKELFGDVSISDTQTLENGSIQKTWARKSGGVQGRSIYKWSGTIWFMVTWKIFTGFENIYGPALDKSIASFEVPEL